MLRATFISAVPCGSGFFFGIGTVCRHRSLLSSASCKPKPTGRRPTSTYMLSPASLAVTVSKDSGSGSAITDVAADAANAVGSAARELSETAQDAVQAVELSQYDGLVSVLSIIIFIAFVYITIGTVIISWDEWRRNRNEEREIKEYLATRGRTTAGVVREKSGEMNRNMRRMEKKRRKQDERDSKRLQEK